MPGSYVFVFVFVFFTFKGNEYGGKYVAVIEPSVHPVQLEALVQFMVRVFGSLSLNI